MKRLVVLAVALTGCATGSPSRIVVLQQLVTKQTVQCKVDPWGSMDFSAQVDKCVGVYKKAGYEVVGDSN
jgi:hypothetical protein